MERRTESQSSYLRIKNHLDEILEQIRSGDLALEQALDLYEEAIRLGNSCADLIDMTDFSLEEIESAALASSDDLSAEADEEKANEDSLDSENEDLADVADAENVAE